MPVGLARPEGMMPALDLLCFGEAYLELHAAQRMRLEQARLLDVYLRGAAAEAAIALARLGMQTAFASRLPDSPLGRLVLSRLRRHGVDCSHVALALDSRIGLEFVDETAQPHVGVRIGDRGATAFQGMAEEDFAELSEASTKCLFISLPTVPDAIVVFSGKLLRTAKGRGVVTVLEDAGGVEESWMEPLAQGCDVVIRGDATGSLATVSGLGGEPVVIGGNPAAVSAGLVYAALTEGPEEIERYAHAFAALQQRRAEALQYITPEELADELAGGRAGVRR